MRQWRNSGVFIVNFEHISHLFSVFLFLTLNQVNASWDMACILKDQVYSVLSSTQIFITEMNLKSWLNEADWPNRRWLASIKGFVCFINKFSTYFVVFEYITFLTCLLGWLVSWKWAGSVSILTFKHGIAHLWKLDRFFFFVQAPCNQNKVFNKQGVLTLEMDSPTKWSGYTYRQNKKTKMQTKQDQTVLL